jgi:hypothetical protein
MACWTWPARASCGCPVRSCALACLFVLVACGSEPLPSASTPVPSRERVVISPLGLSVSVPSGYVVHPRGEDRRGPWVVDLAPGGRQPRRIIISPDGPAEPIAPSERDPACPWLGPVDRSLGDDAHVRYLSSVGCGGSGGVEGVLVGLWELGGRRFSLSCITQSEPGIGAAGPDPAWCLDELRGARVVPATDTPVRLGPTGVEQTPLIFAPLPGGGQSVGEPGE